MGEENSMREKPINLNLGCGPFPLHQQHLEVMGDLKEWVLVDKYVKHPMIKNWDALVLDEVKDGTVNHIYASHLLEHLPQVEIEEVLAMWYRKLMSLGKVTINVPDLEWACAELLRYTNTQPLRGDYYYELEGEHGLMSIFYGAQSHEGEFHKAGFVEENLGTVLSKVGFKNIIIDHFVDAHDMGVLLAMGTK